MLGNTGPKLHKQCHYIIHRSNRVTGSIPGGVSVSSRLTRPGLDENQMWLGGLGAEEQECQGATAAKGRLQVGRGLCHDL